MQFNFTFEGDVSSAPAGFMTALNAAASFLDHLYINNITINVQVGYGTVDGSAMSAGALGQSTANGNIYSYAQVKSDLAANAANAATTSIDDRTSVATLGASDPTNGGQFFMNTAEEKALGLLSGASTGIDGYIGLALNSTGPFSFDPNNRAVNGEYDATAVFEHELTEVMGRYGSLGTYFGTNVYTPLDLFRYTSAGVRDLTPGPGNFSINGQTMLTAYNDPTQGGDAVDWDPNLVGYALGDGYPGTLSAYTPTDVRQMNILGYTRAAAINHDFTGNGIADVLWFNSSANSVADFNELNLSKPSWSPIGSAGSGWTVSFAGDANNRTSTGDFNGDGTSDILWYNASLNGVGDFQMVNGVATWVGIGTAGAGWTLAGIGDFNGDKTSDVLWYNASTNGLGEFQMTNGVAAWKGIGTVGAGWKVAGVGDFNGDGTSDILLFNSTTNSVGEFQMNNGVPTWVGLGSVAAGWSVAGVGDFNGDGASDILFFNASTHAVSEFSMHNGVPTWVGIGSVGAGWSVAGVADLNGDGTSDIIFSSSNGGIVSAGAFLMKNNTPTWVSLGGAQTTGWQIVA